MACYAFTLAEDFECFTRHAAPATFVNSWLAIHLPTSTVKTRIHVRAQFAWDGYSIVPDLRSFQPSLVHDAIYEFAEPIARAWNWTVRQVLEWADAVFLELMKFYGEPRVVAYLYFFGVRLGGYWYHQAARLIRQITGRQFHP
jgi:hypothetical protein